MYDRAQLAALVAVVDHRTFDAAATALSVTPSAISQRIKALEQHVGAVLVRRQRPCSVTDIGAPLLRLARQIALLEDDLPGQDGRTHVPIAVNADSLATWFVGAMAACPPHLNFDLRVADEGRTHALLTDGSVLAAVTTQATPAAGCRSIRLGAIRYRALARRTLLEAFGDSPQRVLLEAPRIRFDADDVLQERFACQVTRTRVLTGPEHRIPASEGFIAGVRLGLGWGMVEDRLAADLIDLAPVDGALVDLAPGEHVEVPLYWQHWRLETDTVSTVTEAVIPAARERLH